MYSRLEKGANNFASSVQKQKKPTSHACEGQYHCVPYRTKGSFIRSLKRSEELFSQNSVSVSMQSLKIKQDLWKLNELLY